MTKAVSKKKQNLIQTMLQQAMNHQVSKNFVASEEVLQKILTLDPNNASAYHYMGLIAKEYNGLDTALVLLERSLALDSNCADVYYNYGVLLDLAHRFDEAKVAYESAVKLNSKMDVAWFNLANAYYKSHDSDAVIRALKHFLSIANHSKTLYPTIVKLYADTGHLDLAKDFYPKAIKHNPKNEDLIWTGVSIIQYQQNGANTLQYIQEKVGELPHSLELRIRLTIYQAMAEWQMGLLDACEHSLQSTDQWIDSFEDNPVNHSLKSYRFFINRLLTYKKNNPSTLDATHSIYLIGDSHSLSNSNQTLCINQQQYRTQSILVVGCKAFHFAQSCDNKFKTSFSLAMSQIPDSSHIIMMVGEIDCRVNEGIINVYKKSHADLQGIIEQTVAGYVSFILSHTQPKGITTYFYGVPAPRRMIDVSEEDTLLQKQIILLFNQTLQHYAVQSGHHFIDIYGLTAGENGLSDGLYHIDDFHLLPKVIEAADVIFI